MSRLGQQRLNADAENRAWRTLLTGVAIDVAVGIALVLGAFFATADGWGDIETTVLTFSVAKSMVQSVCSYILRRFLDPSKHVWTPLPPVDPGPPADEAEHVPPVTALEEPPASEVRRSDPMDPILLGHGPEVLQAVAESKKDAPKPLPRKAVVAKKVAERKPVKSTPLDDLKAEAIKKAPAKKAAPRKKTQ